MEELRPVKSGKVRVDDVNLYYEIYGQGDPLVLVAGTGISLAPWRVATVPATRTAMPLGSRTLRNTRRAIFRTNQSTSLVIGITHRATVQLKIIATGINRDSKAATAPASITADSIRPFRARWPGEETRPRLRQIQATIQSGILTPVRQPTIRQPTIRQPTIRRPTIRIPRIQRLPVRHPFTIQPAERPSIFLAIP